MVRRAPFPPSRIPASIEHSIKLLCVCVCVCEHFEGAASQNEGDVPADSRPEQLGRCTNTKTASPSFAHCAFNDSYAVFAPRHLPQTYQYPDGGESGEGEPGTNRHTSAEVSGS